MKAKKIKYTFETWLDGKVSVKDIHFLTANFSPADRIKIKEQSKQIVLNESEHLAKKLLKIAIEKKAIKETLEFNQGALESFKIHSEFADLENGHIDCFLHTPQFIPKENLYFSILTTHKLIKMLEKA